MLIDEFINKNKDFQLDTDFHNSKTENSVE